MRPLIIYTVCFGKYVDWLHNGLVKSLSWPKNKSSLQHPKTRWYIYGDLEDTQKIYQSCTQVLPFHQIQLKPKKTEKTGGIDLLAMMMETMRFCLLDRVPMLTAPPDTIFSDGSIDAMLEYAESPGTCVAVPHPRVLPSIMNDLGPNPPTNAQLVTLALEKHVHDCWKTSNTDLLFSSGVGVGGICWKKLADKLWAFQHRLPTVYLANFTEEDRKFFSRPWKNVPPQYGMYDHEWPGAELMPEIGQAINEHERIRTIGSSDVAFIAECTEYHKNVPTQRPVDPNNRDAFHRDELHNRVNRQYISCFRGE